VRKRLPPEFSEDMSAKPQFFVLSLAFTFLFSFSSVAVTESLGNLAQYPPERTTITITTADNGAPQLQPEELVLNSGQYYRLTIDCPDVRDDLTGWRIEVSEFLNNAHLRLVTVGDIEVHLQGLSFNAIECDEVGAAHVSFVPIKPGVYPLYVGNVPLAVGRPIGESGVQAKGNFVFGEIVVR
jgi:hypothetical protein